MKKLLLAAVLVVSLAGTAAAGEYVRGHYKDTNRDGIKDTYVQPYYRSDRNNTTIDNYSTKGNVNPYTGSQGTVEPKSYFNDNSGSGSFGNSSGSDSIYNNNSYRTSPLFGN